jgi:hypothetical protein
MASRTGTRPRSSVHRIANGGSDGGIELDRFFYFKIIKTSDGRGRRPPVRELAISRESDVSFLIVFVTGIRFRVTVIRLASKGFEFFVFKTSFQIRDESIVKSDSQSGRCPTLAFILRILEISDSDKSKPVRVRAVATLTSRFADKTGISTYIALMTARLFVAGSVQTERNGSLVSLSAGLFWPIAVVLMGVAKAFR